MFHEGNRSFNLGEGESPSPCLVSERRIVKTFVVEPIVLYSKEASLVGHPEFDLLLQHIEAQDAEIQTLKEQLNATKALADRTAQEVADLQRALEDN